jgi:hypothetical protein
MHADASKRLNAKQGPSGGCSYKKNKKSLVNNAALQPGGELEVWDIEDLVMLGNDLKGASHLTWHCSTACVGFALICRFAWYSVPLLCSAVDRQESRPGLLPLQPPHRSRYDQS